MDIIALTRNDLVHIPELQPPDWSDILPFIDFYTRSACCFPFKAVIDGRMAGIGTAIAHGETGWLGHIIVHPGFRNRGIGGAITQHLVDVLHARGCATLYLVATDLGAPVYERAGFETETEYLFFKEIKPGRKPAAGLIVPFRKEHWRPLIEMDRQVSGEDRTVHIASCLDDAQVYMQGDRLEGFYLPALGDGLIVAATSQAGLACMDLRLQAKDSAIFPADNTAAARFLQAQGYTVHRRARRMRLGATRPWQPEALYNRIGGNLG